ncbi:MAG: hypothetical protein GX621_18330 [Pirellulaceae bacterium]|nr:hypothetical protein [Pirellulaceae bacterium]
MNRHPNLACFLLVAVLAWALPAHAALVFWSNADGDYDFTKPLNWYGDAYPASSDTAVIQNNSYADITTAAAGISKFYVGADQGGTLDPPLAKGTGTLNVLTGGSLTTASTWYVGEGTANQGTVNVEGGSLTTGTIGLGYGSGSTGTLNVSDGGAYTTTTYLNVGREPGSYGILNLYDGSVTTPNRTDRPVSIGYGVGASGTVNQSGGTFTTSSPLNLGAAASSVGAYNQTGGTLNASTHLYLGVGTSSVGVFNQTGGTLSLGGAVYAGNAASAYGYYRLAAGSFTGTGLSPGASASAVGVIEQEAGTTMNISSYGIRVGSGTSGIGLLNQKGGTINLDRVLWAGGASGAWGQVELSGTTTVISTEYVSVARNASTKGYLNLNAGGVLTAPYMDNQATTGEGVFTFHGGTLKPNVSTADPADAATHFTRWGSAPGGLFIGAEGGTIDTDGFDIVISDPLQALVGHGVSSIALQSGGSGYQGSPVVQITGGTGKGATAVATVSGGVVTGIAVTNPGTGYASDDVLTATLLGGGASTNASVVGITLAPNVADGGLQKKGLGTLTLAGANTYTGLTDVQAGTLAVTGSLAGDVEVQSDAVLMGTGSIANLVGADDSTVAPGTSVGTLLVSGNATLAGVLDIEYDSSTGAIDVLGVTGQLDLSGGTLQFADIALEAIALTENAYVFATYGELVGENPTIAMETVPTGYFVDFAHGGNSIALVAIPEPSIGVLLIGLLGTIMVASRRR